MTHTAISKYIIDLFRQAAADMVLHYKRFYDLIDNSVAHLYQFLILFTFREIALLYLMYFSNMLLNEAAWME